MNGCLVVKLNCGRGFGVCCFDVVGVVETFVVEEVTIAVFGLVGFWFDVLDDVGVCVVEEAADVFGCGAFGVVIGCLIVFVGWFVSCCGF